MRGAPERSTTRPARDGRAARAGRDVIVAAALLVAVTLTAVALAVPAGAASARPVTVVAQANEPSGPSPTGQPLPPKSQRIADSVIAVLLLLTLGATVVAVATVPRWNRSRRAGARGQQG